MQARVVNPRTVCLSGILEAFPGCQMHAAPDNGQFPSCLPSTSDLKKARRLASKKRIKVICSECRRIKRQCGDSRICDHCISLGVAMSDDPHHLERGAIDRPIKFGITFLRFRGSTAYPQGSLKYQWSSSIIRSVWEIGYKFSSFENIFNSMPTTLSLSLANLLETVATKSQATSNQTRS